MLKAVKWGSEADLKTVISLAPQREVVLLDFDYFFPCVTYIRLNKMCLCTRDL